MCSCGAGRYRQVLDGSAMKFHLVDPRSGRHLSRHRFALDHAPPYTSEPAVVPRSRHQSPLRDVKQAANLVPLDAPAEHTRVTPQDGRAARRLVVVTVGCIVVAAGVIEWEGLQVALRAGADLDQGAMRSHWLSGTSATASTDTACHPLIRHEQRLTHGVHWSSVRALAPAVRNRPGPAARSGTGSGRCGRCGRCGCVV